VRSQSNSDQWEWREISLIEINKMDLAAAFCNDYAAIRLPDHVEFVVPPGILKPHEIPYLGGCPPSQRTVDAVAKHAARESFPLSELLTLLTANQHAQNIGAEDPTPYRCRYAELSLWEAADTGEISLRGIRTGKGDEVVSIPDSFFSHPDSIRRDVDSLRGGLQRLGTASYSKGVGVASTSENDWQNVVVELTSFRKWFDHAVDEARRRHFKKLRRRRLFEYPFWSVETMLCWITFRDPFLLETRAVEVSKLLSGKTSVSLGTRTDKLEWEPELLLLSALRRGTLKAFEDGRILPPSHWSNASPRDGGLDSTSKAARLEREKVLRHFPEMTLSSRPAVIARRQSKIDRIVERLLQTRRWINCQELDEWLDRREVQRLARRSNDPVRNFIDREMRVGLRSRLRLLSSRTSVVRLSASPVRRWPTDLDAITSSGRAHKVREDEKWPVLSDCWLLNAACRDLVEQLWLELPAHFQARKVPVATGSAGYQSVTPLAATMDTADARGDGEGNLSDPPHRASTRKKTQREYVLSIIEQLYPNGVPDQSLERNVDLVKKVVEALKAKGQRAVSEDTILRAAGRRK
jgi:hypothetical protein